jgi:hypothetical protein
MRGLMLLLLVDLSGGVLWNLLWLLLLLLFIAEKVLGVVKSFKKR